MEKGRETNISVTEKHRPAASHTHLDQGPNSNPGMRPHLESNRPPFPLQDKDQPTEPH